MRTNSPPSRQSLVHEYNTQYIPMSGPATRSAPRGTTLGKLCNGLAKVPRTTCHERNRRFPNDFASFLIQSHPLRPQDTAPLHFTSGESPTCDAIDAEHGRPVVRAGRLGSIEGTRMSKKKTSCIITQCGIFLSFSPSYLQFFNSHQ